MGGAKCPPSHGPDSLQLICCWETRFLSKNGFCKIRLHMAPQANPLSGKGLYIGPLSTRCSSDISKMRTFT